MKKYITLMAVAMIALASCAPKKSAEMKSLVLYYSQTETTKTLAELIQQKTGADIASIEVVNPYGDYGETIQRGSQEVASKNYPELKPLTVDLADYDVIYLGTPVWFGTVANPILSLLETEKFEGKKVVPFVTFGSGGRNTVEDYLRTTLDKADVGACYGVRQARIDKASKELDRFLVEQGLIEGEVEALPGYTEMQPLTEEETAIFEAAIATYPMLAGTVASTCGARVTPDGTDYIFSAGTADRPSSMQIVVTVPAAEGSVPEFVEAIR
ncbi:MAG: hypothetical protein MJY97_03230 [Bacteroidales bacterium]|nr:hypothetical protein [Bacteroidales bacterium]